VLGAHLAEHLAPHKRPRSICFVDRLLHTAGDKLDRPALTALAPALRPLRTRRE
jgi:acyl-coenzyme A synthetase/AMP-(fatty) acid ligase